MKSVRLLFASLCLALGVSPVNAEWTLTRVAGGGPDLLPALEANLEQPTAVAVDASGSMFVVHERTAMIQGPPVLRVDAAGIVHALEATLTSPVDIAAGPDGSAYVSDRSGVVRVDPGSGASERIVTLGGTLGLTVDLAGNVFVAEFTTRTVRRVDAIDGSVSIVAGTECSFLCPPTLQDGDLATSGSLLGPTDVAVDASGDILVADVGRILRVDAATGLVSIVAGTDTPGFSGDGGPAIDAAVQADNLVVDGGGNVYFTGFLSFGAGNDRVRRIDAATGIIDTYAGNGDTEIAGDGGPAIDAAVDAHGIAVDSGGNLLIADNYNRRIRRVDAATGIIDTLAGNGFATFSGDGFPATSAAIRGTRVVEDAGGNVFIADRDNHRVRRVDAASGTISTVAGNGVGTPGSSIDGLPAVDSPVPSPADVAVDSAGNLYVASDERVRRVDASTGLVSTVAGGGAGGVPGPATDADLGFVGQLGLASENELHLATPGRIVRLDLASGQLTVVAGGGSSIGGEGVLATDLDLVGVTPDFTVGADGTVFFRYVFTPFLVGPSSIRRVDPATGLAHTVAGFGATQPRPQNLCEGDCGPLPAVGTGVGDLFDSVGMSLSDRGDLFLTARRQNVIGRVDSLTGVLHPVVGGGTEAGYPFEPRPPIVSALSVEVGSPTSLIYTDHWSVYRAESSAATPQAVAGGDRTLACTSRDGAQVALDGSMSFDADSAITGIEDIEHYWWYSDYGTPAEELIAKGEQATVTLPIGVQAITLRAIDRDGLEGFDTVSIEVLDDGDPDGDGIGSCADSCPDVPNPGQADLDGNGLGDACDPCNAEPFGDPDGDGVCTDVDNCAEVANSDQSDSDLDGIGDACDLCPTFANADQQEQGACIGTRSAGSECIAATVDLRGASRAGRALLSFYDRFPPTSIVLTVLHRTTGPGSSVELLLNGTSLGDRPLTMGIFGGVTDEALRFADSASIASAWLSGQANELRVVKSGALSEVAWVRARTSAAGIEDDPVCIYDIADLGCSGVLTLSAEDFDAAALVDDPFVRLEEVLAVPFAESSLSETVDLDTLEDGEYRLCVASTSPTGSSALYAATGDGGLYEVDAFTGEARRAGTLPVVPASMDHDVASQFGFANGQSGRGFRFDARDGSRIGETVNTNGRFAGLAFVDSILYGYDTDVAISTSSPQPEVAHPATSTTDQVALVAAPSTVTASGFASELSILDPFTGLTQAVGVQPNALVGGMSHLPSGGVTYALLVPPTLGEGGELGRVDLDTGEIDSLGVLGYSARNVEHGPDGLLYAASYAFDEPSTLYRHDPETMQGTPIGGTGLFDVVGLALVGPDGSIDCRPFVKAGESILALNASCGPPIAVAQTVAPAECDSPAGATVLLDASRSTDPNSIDGNDAIAEFHWYELYGTPGQFLVASGETAEAAFAIGSHQVTLEAVNRFGESATDTITVEIVDSTPPDIDGAAPLVVECTSASGVAAGEPEVSAWIATAVATDSCGTASVAADLPSFFPPGETAVTVEATDACGNSAQLESSVTVIDTLPPSLSCAVEALDADDSSGAGELFQIVFEAADSCGDVTTIAVLESASGDDEAGDTCESVPVFNGQLVEAECRSSAGCTDDDEHDGPQVVRSRGTRLEVTAIDAAGNTATCLVSVCPDDNDESSSGESGATVVGPTRTDGLLDLGRTGSHAETRRTGSSRGRAERRRGGS